MGKTADHTHRPGPWPEPTTSSTWTPRRHPSPGSHPGSSGCVHSTASGPSKQAIAPHCSRHFLNWDAKAWKTQQSHVTKPFCYRFLSSSSHCKAFFKLENHDKMTQMTLVHPAAHSWGLIQGFLGHDEGLRRFVSLPAASIEGMPHNTCD